MEHSQWHPKWWKDEYGSAWERIREAVRRDWQQTLHDLHAGGHELNQKVGDTFKQAEGKAPIPDINRANPPSVIGTLDGQWEKVEQPMKYGFAAGRQFGDLHPAWDQDIERKLEAEWEAQGPSRGTWGEIRGHVQKGYERSKS
jgi:hypothetical protein